MTDTTLVRVFDEEGNLYMLPQDVAATCRVDRIAVGDLVAQVSSVDFDAAGVPAPLRAEWEALMQTETAEAEGQDAGLHLLFVAIALGLRILRIASSSSQTRGANDTRRVFQEAWSGTGDVLRVKPVAMPVADPSIGQPTQSADYRTAAVGMRCQYCAAGMMEHQAYFSNEGLMMCKSCFAREQLGESVARALGPRP